MPRLVEWSMSERQLAAFKKRVERYQGRPVAERMKRGNLAAAQYLARPIRAGSPVGKTGKLKRSVKARLSNRSGLLVGTSLRTAARLGAVYQTSTALVGPTAPHRHLVVRGHRIVTRGGRDTGRRSAANPYVDRAIAAHKAQALRIVSRILLGN